jgi:hypothetical protein
MKHISRVDGTEADPILQWAQREASLEHAGEFMPITKGPVFAMVCLIPLGCAMAVFAAVSMAWRIARRVIVKSA